MRDVVHTTRLSHNKTFGCKQVYRETTIKPEQHLPNPVTRCGSFLYMPTALDFAPHKGIRWWRRDNKDWQFFARYVQCDALARHKSLLYLFQFPEPGLARPCFFEISRSEICLAVFLPDPPPFSEIPDMKSLV